MLKNYNFSEKYKYLKILNCMTMDFDSKISNWSGHHELSFLRFDRARKSSRFEETRDPINLLILLK